MATSNLDDLSFSSHGECVVTVFFWAKTAAISRDASIAANAQSGIDGVIRYLDGKRL
jgi:hypothetical protein